MKKPNLPSISVLIMMILLTGCGQNKTRITEESFLGQWYCIKGNVEIYSFLKDNNNYIFTGTESSLPVVCGTWKIDKDKFILTIDNGASTTFFYSLANDTLVFNYGQEIYTRTTPLDVQFPEVRILKDISSDLGLAFSKPEQAEIKSGISNNMTNPPSGIPLNVFSITLKTNLLSGELEKITEYLTDYGFEKDTIFKDNSCPVFRNDKLLVMICTIPKPEADNDSVQITVSSAVVK